MIVLVVYSASTTAPLEEVMQRQSTAHVTQEGAADHAAGLPRQHQTHHHPWPRSPETGVPYLLRLDNGAHGESPRTGMTASKSFT